MSLLTPSPVQAAAPSPALRSSRSIWARRLASVARTWLTRYGPQDAASKLALSAWSLGVGSGPPALAAAVEIGAFYAVALHLERRRGARTAPCASVVRRLLGEYGPAELCDWLVRPGLMSLGFSLCGGPALGWLAGSLAADVAFYAIAMASARRQPRKGFGAARVADPDSTRRVDRAA